MRVTRETILLAACFVGPATAAALVPVKNQTAVSLSDEASVPVWNGTTALRRSEAQAWYGSSAFFLGSIAGQVCSTTGLITGVIPCAIALAASVAGAIFPVIASFTHRTKTVKGEVRGRAIDAAQMNMRGYYNWEYPSHPVLEASKAYNDTADGLPVRMGNTVCNAENSPCFSIWYSREELSEVSLHHVHIRPFDFDFRQRTTVRPSNDEFSQLHGGYVFKPSSEATLANIVTRGQRVFVDTIARQMHDMRESAGKFSHDGCYCMDFTSDGYSDAGTKGFMYFYSRKEGYPAGSEQSIYDICAREAALKQSL